MIILEHPLRIADALCPSRTWPAGGCRSISGPRSVCRQPGGNIHTPHGQLLTDAAQQLRDRPYLSFTFDDARDRNLAHGFSPPARAKAGFRA
jgi:hypothetical protein